ncbi:ESPR-type extended signal peptide-containing protein [Caballeronia novacaledonica]|uniref:ESPR-type extended signal peptide-containing protein n=1 Tax=Caballeronia novacaledonica TaxID=1544861 RepID=UPI003857B8EC
MNKSYRSIWNEKVGTFVAVAETSMARGKRVLAARYATRKAVKKPLTRSSVRAETLARSLPCLRRPALALPLLYCLAARVPGRRAAVSQPAQVDRVTALPLYWRTRVRNGH